MTPVTGETRPVVERLWQLYRHDLSEFRGLLPDGEGLFSEQRLSPYLTEEDKRAYLLCVASSPVGFALVRRVQDGTIVLGEFLVVRAARRQRLGHDAAVRLLALYPGRWEIAFQEENPAAAQFWRRVAAAAVGDAWREDRRSVPGKPEVPPDVWITLDSLGTATR